MELTKWPRLLVTGQPVTEEQANDILIRTPNLWLLHTNDREWTASIGEVLGIEAGKHGFWASDSIKAAETRLRCLDLQWLYTSRIASSWIGGPHGWCNWDGTIGSANYNIGKWPEVESVTEEWQQIAAAFPYLDLRAQLITDEGTGEIAAEWTVNAGRAVHREPEPGDELITQPRELGQLDLLDRLFIGGERGVPLPRLRAAVAQVRESASA
ncbi:hypothetical protein OOK58_42105 [Streptomyces sp. NBC_01728]|uniref:hypothetical protein n=1 Tax=Streptomyces TaxID=1883 RepID=UPI0022565E3D|nr:MULTISPECIES: hypothetical protein [Streptomyces]MCX4458509.1 hypothetical protein [Streptomyces sp. NBC_01719]MCX4497866.1 hypothetical protein [Streptomyces sp. NBC_01728]MCX4609476.1 hypothetical protein [Streptomyces mirabilis]